MCGAAVAGAQGPSATETALGVTGLWSRRPYYGLEGGLGLRPAGQVRFVLTLGAGVRNSRAAGRVTGEAQFLVLPAARSGLSPYVGLGLAGTLIDSRHSTGALTLTAGVEAAEGNRVGWYIEGGAAGEGAWRRGSAGGGSPPGGASGGRNEKGRPTGRPETPDFAPQVLATAGAARATTG